MTQMFTDTMLKNVAAPATGRVEIWDRRIPGFGLRVSSSGTKTFILVYRHRGRPRRLTLGRYPFMKLAEARHAASDALNKVSAGADPALVDKDKEDPAYHFDRLVNEFVDKHCKVHNKPRSAKETERLLRTHFVTAWTKRDVRDVTQNQVIQVLDKLLGKDSPSEANHALAAIKTMLNWCMDRELILVNPCSRLKKPARVRSRDRVLTDAEIKAVWRAFEADGCPFGAMGKLLLLTGQRRGEVTQMCWNEVDLDLGVWTIPAEKAKNSQAHYVPLTSLAKSTLHGVPRGGAEWVFPARGNDENSISGFSKAKRRIDEVSATSGWTFHDLRRTVSTGMGKIGIPPHVIERVLNHSSGELGGVAGIYNRYQYLPEMRAALERWSVHVEYLVA